METSATRILVLEPDFERGERLKQLIGECVDADVVVVRSAREAIAGMSSQVPDVILTSVLLPPRDDAQLRATSGAAGYRVGSTRLDATSCERSG
jgi:CheY-like chemotaxis protein